MEQHLKKGLFLEPYMGSSSAPNPRLRAAGHVLSVGPVQGVEQSGGWEDALFRWAPSLHQLPASALKRETTCTPVPGADAFNVSSCSCCRVAGLSLSLRTSPHFPFCVHPHNLSIIHAQNISESNNSPALYPGLQSLLAHILFKGHLPARPHGLTPTLLPQALHAPLLPWRKQGCD